MTRFRTSIPALAFLCALAAPAGLADRATAQEQRIRSSVDDHLVDAETKAAIERGLDYLQKTQTKTGSWDQLVGYKLNSDYETVDNRPLPHVGVTALAGIAFLAGGHLPDRGKYGDTITRALEHVISCSQDDGQITEHGTRMYSHAFATLFLAEVYGMAGGAQCKVALERAVNLIVDSQNQHGGWRYNPFDRETDLSVTVCQLQALRAARNIGIKVPDDTVERAITFWPMAAWMAMSNICRGITSFSFSTSARPLYAAVER